MKGGGHMKGDGHHMGGMKGMPGGHHLGGMKGMPGAGHMKGWKRFGRGHIIPPHFRGGQYFVHNWQSFGWPAPMPGGQWIRYYDDALLIDGHGRVMDSRYGWDWDRRGRSMAYDDGGYDEGYAEDGYAEDDYEREDYAGHDGGYGRGHGDGGDCRRGGCGPVGHLPPPPPDPSYGYSSGHGYGSGYSYGYGAGCACGPVVVTETITTTAPVMETRTYYETVTEHRAAPRRYYKKPVVRRSVKPAYRAPAPRPGERG
jgi:hypothetical protein